MKTVFVLQHVDVFPSGEEDVKFIGVYRSSEAACEAIERLKTQPGFRDFPRLIDPTVDDKGCGFDLAEYELDTDHWAEGFVSV